MKKDLYLSNISPLGVPFNTIKGMTNDFFKSQRIASGKAGSSCPKKYLALSKEYKKEGIPRCWKYPLLPYIVKSAFVFFNALISRGTTITQTIMVAKLYHVLYATE